MYYACRRQKCNNRTKSVIKVLSVITFGPKRNRGLICFNVTFGPRHNKSYNALPSRPLKRNWKEEDLEAQALSYIYCNSDPYRAVVFFFRTELYMHISVRGDEDAHVLVHCLSFLDFFFFYLFSSMLGLSIAFFKTQNSTQYPERSGFSRLDATLRKERNDCEGPFASLIDPPSSAMNE